MAKGANPEGNGWKCTPVVNRKNERHFTANDAARIMCYAKKNGATEKEIMAKARGKCWQGYDCEELRQKALEVLEGIAFAIVLIGIPELLAGRLAIFLARWLPEYWIKLLGLEKVLKSLPQAREKLTQLSLELREVLERISKQ